MEKKLSQDSIARIDGAVQRFVAAWSDLKQAWAQLDTPQALDKAFYEFVDVWLATDRTVDQETHAHSLEYWNDPDLESVRQAITPLQVRLSKTVVFPTVTRDLSQLDRVARKVLLGLRRTEETGRSIRVQLLRRTRSKQALPQPDAKR